MENMNFWIAQFIGLIALILLVFSYSRKNTNKILAVQIVSALLYCVHYYLLGAYSGFMICLFEMMRDYLYYKTDLDDFVFIISIPIYILMGYISYHTFADLLPLFASTVDGFGLTKSKSILEDLLTSITPLSLKEDKSKTTSAFCDARIYLSSLLKLVISWRFII